MKRNKRTYSREFKIKAVELSNQRGNMSSVAKELDINPDNLKRWRKEFSLGKLTTEEVRTKSKEELEIIRLQNELYETKLERDILKKAVSIFSKSDR